MSLLVKICGLNTPDALDAALDAGADMVGFVFFPPSPRNISVRDGACARRAGEGPRREGRAHGRCRRRDARRSVVEALKPDMLQLHGKETPERVAAVRAALRPAGDEGAADRDASRSRRRSALYARRRRPPAVRRARRRARRRGPAGSASRSTGTCWRISTSINSVHAVGRARRRQCRRGAARSRARRRSMSRPGSRARRARRTRTRSAPSSARRARPLSARRAIGARMTAAAAQFVPHRPRRARALRHLRRPLRRRDADAADPRAGEGLRRRPRPIRRSRREMDGHLEELCRPAVAALFRRAADRSISAARRSTSSARTSTTPARTR